MSVLDRVPVVGGMAYIERVRQQPSSFEARLEAEPGNRYFPHAIAVMSGPHKLGYVAPEVSRRYFDRISASVPAPTSPARRATTEDHETSGVELLLDFSAFGPPE